MTPNFERSRNFINHFRPTKQRSASQSERPSLPRIEVRYSTRARRGEEKQILRDPAGILRARPPPVLVNYIPRKLDEGCVSTVSLYARW